MRKLQNKPESLDLGNQCEIHESAIQKRQDWQILSEKLSFQLKSPKTQMFTDFHEFEMQNFNLGQREQERQMNIYFYT